MKDLRQILMQERPLPGRASHLKMAPFSRRDSLMKEGEIPQDAKVSAVLVLLVQSCEKYASEGRQGVEFGGDCP